MGVQKRYNRLDLQSSGLHTAPTSRKTLKSLNGFTTSISSQQKTPRKFMEELSGSLQHVSFRIPGGTGVFSPIHVALKGTIQWLHIITNLTQCFYDWGVIINHMGKHPNQVRHMVNKLQNYIRYSDSCGVGTGGGMDIRPKKIGPIIWQE